MPSAPLVRLVEQFHLLFLGQLGRGTDKQACVLKGGCNLRFFYRSPRYSEDLDLDVSDLAPHALRERVRGIFASRPFAQILSARGIAVEHTTEQKQTDTTQRWKIGLRVAGTGAPLPTKIEFSRRGLDDEILFGSVDPAVIRAHALAPLMAAHYGPHTAFLQKLGALAHRSETQARDIFDLHHLMGTGDAAGALKAMKRETAAKARANALSIDFGTFKSQVLAFLLPEDQTHYDSATVWDTIVLEVVEALEKAAA